MIRKLLFIESCNYQDYPLGGHLSFAKQMLKAFGNQLVLVGISTDETPVGIWTKKVIDGIEYDYFAFRKMSKSSKKPLIPERLQTFIAILKYRNKILSSNHNNIFLQTPDILFALPKGIFYKINYRIAGVENPFLISRYSYGKYLAKIYNLLFYNAIKNVCFILASADRLAIDNFLHIGKGILKNDDVIQFPTRIDTEIFTPKSKLESRKEKGINLTQRLIVTTGRLGELKGWKFMMECFAQFLRKNPDSLFYFLGDGEDRGKIERYLSDNNLNNNVEIKGRVSHEDLAIYLNAADLYIMGSYVEGWSTSLVEAISCAKPVVCTNFSSAKELIENNKNGFVIENHNQIEFVNAMEEALLLDEEYICQKAIEMKKFSVSNLKEDILNIWGQK